MRAGSYQLKFLLCCAVFGQVLRGTRSELSSHPGYQRPPHCSGGRLRCCYCGGSVYLEPIAPRLVQQITRRVAYPYMTRGRPSAAPLL